MFISQTPDDLALGLGPVLFWRVSSLGFRGLGFRVLGLRLNAGPGQRLPVLGLSLG